MKTKSQSKHWPRTYGTVETTDLDCIEGGYLLTDMGCEVIFGEKLKTGSFFQTYLANVVIF